MMQSEKNLCEKKVLFQERMHSLTSVSKWGRFPPQFFEKKLIQGGLKNDNPFSLKNFPYNLSTRETTLNACTRQSLDTTHTPLFL